MTFLRYDAAWLEVVEIGIDDDGDKITSCIIVPVDGLSSPSHKSSNINRFRADCLNPVYHPYVPFSMATLNVDTSGFRAPYSVGARLAIIRTVPAKPEMLQYQYVQSRLS